MPGAEKEVEKGEWNSGDGYHFLAREIMEMRNIRSFPTSEHLALYQGTAKVVSHRPKQSWALEAA
jgi:hypothetical protein